MSTRIYLKRKSAVTVGSDVTPPNKPIFSYDPHTQELWKDKTRIAKPLGPQVAALLSVLIERPDELVAFREIHAVLWPGIPYPGEPNPAIRTHVKVLRELFCDSEESSFIENVRGKGYRFVGLRLNQDSAFPSPASTAPAAMEPASAPEPHAQTSEPKPPHPAREQPPMFLYAAFAALFFVGVAALAWNLASAESTKVHQEFRWYGPSVVRLGDVSPDGHYLCYTDPHTEQLRIRDLDSGHSWTVTSKPPHSNVGGVINCAFSPAGKRLVYRKNMGSSHEIRTVSITGSQDRFLLSRQDTARVSPTDWFPDGLSVLVIECRPGKPAQLLRVQDSDDAAVSTQLVQHCPENARMSPDGEWLAYQIKESPERSTIHVSSSRHQTSNRIVSGRVELADWSPDGKGIVYAKGNASTDFLFAPILKGLPQGDQTTLSRALGFARIVSIDANGDIHYGLQNSFIDTFVAEMDFASGRSLKAPQRLRVGRNDYSWWADWSPSGEEIAFLPFAVTTGERYYPTPVFIQKRNALSALTPRGDVLSFDTLRWTADGTAFLASAGDAAQLNSLYRVERNSGEVTALRRGTDLSTFYYDPIQSAFDRAIYYKLRRHNQEPSRLFRMKPGSAGADEEVVSSVYSFALSHDGRFLVYSSFDEKEEFIRILNLTSGNTQEIHRETRLGRINSVVMTADSRLVLYTRKGQLWKIPFQGGKPEPLPLRMTGMHSLRPHPDGRRLAFAAGDSDRGDLWVLKNSLRHHN